MSILTMKAEEKTFPLRIGYFSHWFQPSYRLEEFLADLGFKAEKIDYAQKGYLEKFDVAVIEQNGFNDYIENDELYFQDWVRRGGICLFLHQDYQRWTPCFLPTELGYVQLIHRHVQTILDYRNYMMPWIEECGQCLFHVPEAITPDEMLDWNVAADSFGIVWHGGSVKEPTMYRSAAQSCYLANPKWKVLGSYMDPAVRDGALILQAEYGKGLYFLNQLMMPEKRVPETDRCFRFWKKYAKNLFAYFARFKAGEAAPAWKKPGDTLPIRKNCRMAIHMHSLDWYGCDAAPGTAYALMRYRNIDVCALSVKDTKFYQGKLDPTRFSDDSVLFLDGQEYHPFNWGDKWNDKGHNTYHILAIGTDPDAYTPEFTRSLFSDDEIDAYLKKALDYVHSHGGAACATHPYVDYWKDYPFDAVDMEPFHSIAGTDIEKYWLSGKKIAIMDSVDFFGVRSYYDNPALNFIYLNGEKPCRDSIIRAVKAGHVIAGTFFTDADITLGNALPGDTLRTEDAEKSVLEISAKIFDGVIREVRVYSGDEVIHRISCSVPEVRASVPLKGMRLRTFVRVEVEGETPKRLIASTPFYLF